MPKTFDVPVSHDTEPYTVNPANIAFIRRQQIKTLEHAPDCAQDDFCPLKRPDKASEPGMKGCYESEVQEATEICFINTVGAQSSIITPVPKRDIKNLWDEAMRYNI